VPEIARELQVDGIVRGAVSLRGDSLHITVRLTAGPSNHQLWEGAYARDRQSAMSLYNDVARGIALEARVNLSARDETRLTGAPQGDPVANDLNLRGRYYCDRWTREDLARGIANFRQAIDLDPTFALAYDGLGGCYASLPYYTVSPPEDAYPKAKAAALRALALDSTLGSAHATLGMILYQFELDLPGADSAFSRAIDLAPGAVRVRKEYAQYLSLRGRIDDAVAQARRGRKP